MLNADHSSVDFAVIIVSFLFGTTTISIELDENKWELPTNTRTNMK